MPPQILVVGSGIIGASIGWHLTAAGARVTIVDAGDAGGVATPASFAWINAGARNPEPYFRLRFRAMAEWRRLAAGIPALPLAWTGGLCWDLPPAELDAYAHQHAEWGYDIRRVRRAEAARIEPNLVSPPERAVHVASEGAVEPRRAAEVMLADAAARGARLLPHTVVTGLTSENDRVTGLSTTAGRLDADEIVLAAGAGTAALAATAGIILPMTKPPGLLVQSHPHAKLLNGLVLAPGLHMRQALDGRIIVAADFGGMPDGADAVAATAFAEARAMLRGGDALALHSHVVGNRPMPADGFPVVGRANGLTGLYLAVAHSGITLAPALGLFAADEILAGRCDPLLAPYGPYRFAVPDQQPPPRTGSISFSRARTVKSP